MAQALPRVETLSELDRGDELALDDMGWIDARVPEKSVTSEEVGDSHV